MVISLIDKEGVYFGIEDGSNTCILDVPSLCACLTSPPNCKLHEDSIFVI